MLTRVLRDLVAAARDSAVQLQDGQDHTVAAALLTASGRHILGLNSYHYLGGPCAEITALANHAAEAADDPVEAIVAVYGPTGQVIPPCGKCRQVLYDLDASISCVIRGSNGLEAVSVKELLPHAYDWRSSEKPQRVYMWSGYRRAIECGAKRQTIRVDDPFFVGRTEIVFEEENGSIEEIAARIVSVVSIKRNDLTEEHARKDGFASLDELQQALDLHYPGLGSSDSVDVVTFDLD